MEGAARATINQDLDLIKSCIEVTRDAARPRCGTERQRGMMRFLMLAPIVPDLPPDLFLMTWQLSPG